MMIDVNGNKGGDGVGLDDLKAIMSPRLPVSAGDRGTGEGHSGSVHRPGATL